MSQALLPVLVLLSATPGRGAHTQAVHTEMHGQSRPAAHEVKRLTERVDGGLERIATSIEESNPILWWIAQLVVTALSAFFGAWVGWQVHRWTSLGDERRWQEQKERWQEEERRREEAEQRRLEAKKSAILEELLSASRDILDARGRVLGAQDRVYHNMCDHPREAFLARDGELFSTNLPLQEMAADAVKYLPIRVMHDAAVGELFDVVGSTDVAESVYRAYASLHELAGIRDAFLRSGDARNLDTWDRRLLHFLRRSHQCVFTHLLMAIRKLGGTMPYKGRYYWLPRTDFAEIRSEEENRRYRCPKCKCLIGWIVDADSGRTVDDPSAAGDAKDAPARCPECDRDTWVKEATSKERQEPMRGDLYRLVCGWPRSE